MSDLFIEDEKAQLEVMKIQLRAMQDKMEEIKPLYQRLHLDIQVLESTIKQKEEELKKL